MTAGLLVLKVEYAVLLGLITAILDIIPVIGPGIALVIALIVNFKAGWLTMILIIAVFSLAQLVENNFVRPLVFSKLLDIHPLIIYFFIFVTAQYLGVVGVIFAPAIAATTCVLVEELYIKNIN
jgi:predicted PurR-regulated permease PerM